MRTADTKEHGGAAPILRPERCAEHQLWAAVLHQAVEDVRHPERAEENGAELRAISWLRSPDTGTGSSRWVCALLDLDHQAVLDRLGIQPELRDTACLNS